MLSAGGCGSEGCGCEAEQPLIATVPATTHPLPAVFPQTSTSTVGRSDDDPGNLRPSMFMRPSTPAEDVTNQQSGVGEEEMEHTDNPESQTSEKTACSI